MAKKRPAKKVPKKPVKKQARPQVGKKRATKKQTKKKAPKKKAAKKPIKKKPPVIPQAVPTAAARLRNKAQSLTLDKIRSKISNGQILTAKELGVLEKAERKKREESAIAHFADVPKLQFCEMIGRQPKTLIEMASMYGMPYPKERDVGVNVFEMLVWLFDHITTHNQAIAKSAKQIKREEVISSEMMEDEGLKDWSEIWVKEKALKEVDSRLIRERELVQVPVVVEVITWLAERMNAIGIDLGKKFGADAEYPILDLSGELRARLVAEFPPDDGASKRET